MRDFTWQMFELTGDIEAYLLYRAVDMANLDTVYAVGDENLAMDEQNPVE